MRRKVRPGFTLIEHHDDGVGRSRIGMGPRHAGLCCAYEGSRLGDGGGMMFVSFVLLFLARIFGGAVVVSQIDLNSGWFVRSYWVGPEPRQMVWFKTFADPLYRHPDEGADWVWTGSKPLLSRSWPRTEISGIYIDIHDYVAVLEMFGASGQDKHAAICEYIDYLKAHRTRAEPIWDFDTKRVWIEDQDGSVILLWPTDQAGVVCEEGFGSSGL
ncbi:MAG: hypothetical protein LAT64_11025 [Phycisphaerales bacterium]|nr:hypothetical protein [Planctomycetota bacterium]MCH8509283.1 hypothetical protein [Phycisphaerales bacterium]